METLNTRKKKDKFIRQLLIYSAAFFITALGAYFVFYFCGRTFLQDCDGNIDGIAQQYPIYTRIKHIVEGILAGQGFSAWEWDIGLGDDSFVTYNGKLLNPLTYICIAFPYKYLDIGYCLMTVVSQYLTGVAFMIFLRGVNIRGNRVIMGGICYAFCGWIIYSLVRQCSFTTVAILLPLIILGVDKILRKESPALFVSMVALHLIYGVLWAYIDAIVVIGYFIIRYFYYHKGEKISSFIKSFLTFMVYGMMGALIATAVIIQNLYKYGNATTSSTVEKQALFSIKDYLTYPAGFFEMTTVQEPYSILTVSVICVVLMPMIIVGIKQRKTASIIALLLFLASLIPLTGSILNGMSYSVGRWFYVLMFFIIWATIEQFTAETFRSKAKVIAMLAWLLALGAWNIGVCYLIIGTLGKHGALCTAIGLILGLIVIALCYMKANDKVRFHLLGLSAQKSMAAIIMLVVMTSIVGYVNMQFFPGVSNSVYEMDMVGVAKSKLDSSTQRIAAVLQEEDDSFFRTDQVDGYSDTRIARVRANENIYFGNRSIYTYFSSMDSGWHKYNKIMGNNAGYFDRTTSFSNDNRAGMDFLMGVKYFLGDSETLKPGASDYAPYGFSYYKTIDGVQVLRNKYDMGLGTTYSQYITESQLMEYSELEREQVIMQAAVVPDDQADKVENIKHASKADIKTELKTVDFKLSEGERASLSEGAFQIKESEEDKGGNFTITIPKVENAQIVVAFKGLIREKASYQDSKDLRTGDSIDRNVDTIKEKLDQQAYRDNEKFQLTLTYGNVVKAGQCRKSKNQGFSDVEDYFVNIGYYDSIEGDIDVYIDRLGNYTYDEIIVYAVPMDIYDENASVLEKNSYQVESFDNDQIVGSYDADVDSIMYLSILDTPGWSVYVDGEKSDRVNNVNITFLGVKVPAGHHQVVMKYQTPGLKIGLILSLAGIIILVGVSLILRRKKNN